MSVYSFGAIRRGGIAGAAAAILMLVTVGLTSAQEQQQQAPAAEQAQPAAVNFKTSAGILIHQIKGDRTGDFDWLVGKMKDALTKSEDPKIKQQATGFRVYKNVDPLPQTGNILYVIVVSPTVADADYNMITLLNIVYKAFPEEQQEIYKRVSGAFGGGITLWNLELVSDFSK